MRGILGDSYYFNFLIGRHKAKGRISKQMLQGNKAHQIFSKDEHFFTSDKHTALPCQGARNVRFSKNLACFVFL